MRTENEHTFWGGRVNEQKREKADEKRMSAKSSLSSHHQKNPIIRPHKKLVALNESLSERLTLYQKVTIQEFEWFRSLSYTVLTSDSTCASIFRLTYNVSQSKLQILQTGHDDQFLNIIWVVYCSQSISGMPRLKSAPQAIYYPGGNLVSPRSSSFFLTEFTLQMLKINLRLFCLLMFLWRKLL